MAHWSEVLTNTLVMSRHHGYHSVEKLLLDRLQAFLNDFATSKASATVEHLDDAFIAACRHGELAMVNLVIKHNILQVSNKIAQAFDAAVDDGHVETVRTLIESGVAVDMRLDDLGNTALVAASTKGHADLVRLLLYHGAEVSHRGVALRAAVEMRLPTVVKMLLDAGADPNTCGKYPEPVRRRSTTLHIAVRFDSVETVRVLLEHNGTDADALDGYGQHAIRIASTLGYVDCVQLLLERSIPLEHLNNAAVDASDGGFTEIVNMLVAKGAALPDD